MKSSQSVSDEWDRLTAIAKKHKQERAARLKEYKKRYMKAYGKGQEYSIKNDSSFIAVDLPTRLEKLKKENIQKLMEVEGEIRKFMSVIEDFKECVDHTEGAFYFVLGSVKDQIKALSELKIPKSVLAKMLNFEMKEDFL
jgi:hypothetical protein